MTDDWCNRAEAICFTCAGRCCVDAHPPISGACYERLLAQGVPADAFEWRGYRAVKAKNDGTCVMCKGTRCSIHTIKPETCRAGPFTFDVRGETIEIFLKDEAACPVVRLLREVPEAYRQQFAIAKQSITHLVRNMGEDELAAICRIEEPETIKVAELPREYHDYRH